MGVRVGLGLGLGVDSHGQGELALLRQPLEDLRAKRHERTERWAGGARCIIAKQQQVARPRLYTSARPYRIYLAALIYMRPISHI